MNLTYCLAEDREGAEIGLKLAILSLADHCPGVPVVLYRPNPIPSFVDWLKQQPQVRLVAEPLRGASSWNCKPQAMLPLLGDDPEAEVVWVDSDLMVSRDPRELFRRLSIETLGITQEPPSHPDPGVRLRAEGWGRCLRMIGFGHWALCGLPVTLVATCIDTLGMTHKIRKD